MNLFRLLLCTAMLFLAGLQAPALLACPGATGGAVVQYLGCTDTDGNGSTIQVSSPAGTQADDFLLAAIATDGSPSISAPPGWTQVDQGAADDNAARLAVFARFAPSDGAQSHTFSLSNNEQYYAWLMRFSGTSGVVAAAAATGEAFQAQSPGVITENDNSMIVRLGAFDGSATDNDPGIIIQGHNNITQRSSSGNSGSAASGGAAWVTQTSAGASGNAAFSSAPGCSFFFIFCWGVEEYRTLTVALGPFSPAFRISHAGTGRSCAPNSVRITADTGDGSVDTDYTGTVRISTSSNQGFWSLESGEGSLASGAGNGTATYSFVADDQGEVTLRYVGNAGQVNFDVQDGSREESPLYDPDMLIEDCAGDVTSGPLSCEVFDSGNASFTHAAGIPDDSDGNRMVLVFWGGRGGGFSPASATFAGAPMQSVAFSFNGGGGNASSQLFAILDEDLPADAGDYQVTLSGAADSYAACAMTLTGVEQVIPQGNGASLPVNTGFSFVNSDTVSTTITTQGDNAFVIGLVGNNRNGSYTHSLADERYDASFGRGSGRASFSVASESLGSAGQLTAVSEASSTNRQAQVVASFLPAPLDSSHFTISHGGTGDNCSVNTVTASAMGFDETYEGTITISDNTGTGNWVLVDGDPAAFTDLGNGEARYTFTAADQETVEFGYSNTSTGTYNFDIVDDDMNRESPFFDDNLEIEDCPNQVDHYSVSHAGNGIACLTTAVTITPHTIAHEPTDTVPGTTVALGTSNGKGTWGNPQTGGAFSATGGSGQASYGFLPGETSVTFPFNHTDVTGVSESFTITVADNASPTRVALENPVLTFAGAGLRFFNETRGTTDWPTLVAGMPSNLSGEVLTVQAIRASDEDPGACEPLFSPGSVRSVELAFECNDPANCSAAGIPVEVANNGGSVGVMPVSSNGGAWVNESGFVEMPLLFEDVGGYPAAELVLSYADAGALQAHARYEIPLEDGAGPPSGNDMIGSGSPNSALGHGQHFIVRPFAYDIDFSNDRQNNGNTAAADSWASGAGDSAFMVAGEDFPATVSAVAWQAVDDADLNGIPDPGAVLFDNPVTPNYGMEVNPGSADASLGFSLIEPAGGADGILSNTAFSSFSLGSQTRDLSYSEVGILDIQAALDSGDYLGGGQTVIGRVTNVGRFYPDRFALLSSSLTPRSTLSCSMSPFTYMGEAFDIDMSLVARNADGDVTENYIGDYALLDTPADLGLGAILDIDGAADEAYSSRLDSSLMPGDFSDNWQLGFADITGSLIFQRGVDSEPDGPFEMMQLVTVPRDSDGVTLDSWDVDLDDGVTEPGADSYRLLATHEFRYGRILLRNAYGSELALAEGGIPLDLHLDAEYFDGDGFVVNQLDECTVYDSDALVFISGDYGGGLDVLPVSGTLYAGQTQQSPVNPDADDVPLLIEPPGEGAAGSSVVELDLESLGLGFLRYEWRGAGELLDENPDGSYDDDPRALIEFGTYRGHDRILYWREVVQ